MIVLFKFIKMEDTLLIARVQFDTKSSKFAYPETPCTIVLQNFYEMTELFYTIQLLFEDVSIFLNDYRDQINDATDVENFTNELSINAVSTTHSIVSTIIIAN